MSGLVTYNGQLLIKGGGLAGTKACCCTGVLCFCVTRTLNYAVVERWIQCYRIQYYNPVTSSWVFPDGVPCGWGDSPCQPNSTGWYFITNYGGGSASPWPTTSPPPGFPTSCGCGGTSGSGYSLSLIDSPTKATACSRILPPP